VYVCGALTAAGGKVAALVVLCMPKKRAARVVAADEGRLR